MENGEWRMENLECAMGVFFTFLSFCAYAYRHSSRDVAEPRRVAESVYAVSVILREVAVLRR